MTRLTITSAHPVRAAVAGLDNYHDSKGEMISAVCAALADHNIEADGINCPGDEGYDTFVLRPVPTEHVLCECCADRADRAEFANCVVIAWYTMGSGRIELTTYIS